MNEDFGTSRKLAAVHATGERREIVKKTPLICNARNPNLLWRFAADGKRAHSRINLRSRARIETSNVRTLYQTGKWPNVIQEMNRCNISAPDIAETHRTSKRYFNIANGEIIIFLGSQNHRGGVGVILSKSVSDSMITYRPISNKVLYIRATAAPFNISYVKVHALITEATGEEVEKFYD